MNFVGFKTIAALGLLGASAVLTGCGGGSDGGSTPAPTAAAEGTAQYVAENTELKGNFTESVTLDASKRYAITGAVNFLDGTTLTIPAGTVLYGSTGNSYLAINQGARIVANGTATAPIIFTSAQDVAGQNSAGNEQGQWGGLTILGKAKTNKGPGRVYEAGTQPYGPQANVVENNADDSGVLNYVVIKHTGFVVEQDQELNGLSLGAVGSGTQISNIAILGSADDGIEFWGGTVNVSNIYVENAGDDSLDTDEGYDGTMTNVFVEQFQVDDETDSRAIEADGKDDDPTGDTAAEMSVPKLKNATLITIGRAIRLREGTGYEFDNVQVTVKSTSATLPASPTQAEIDSFKQTVAAVRISDQHTFDFAQINAVNGGLAIDNNAIDPADCGNAVVANVITDGCGLYRDDATQTYMRSSLSVPVKDNTNDNSVTGADLSAFDWVLNVKNTPVTQLGGSGNINVEVLQGDITASRTLTADKTYAIYGTVNVVAPAELTIQAGTTLFGATGNSYMAINRGAKIFANGTAQAPIVFTSAQDIAGQNTGDEQGQWGGLTILGNARSNKGANRVYEAGTQNYGADAGGNFNDADSSGSLQYVVVKYTGFVVEKDQELNGISLGGVGSGTVMQNIASIGSADDGIEFWGGSVSVNGLYIYNAGDDSLDTDEGYRGTLQNVYVEQNVVDDEVDSRIIEADSNSTTVTGDPQSRVDLRNAILKSKGRAVRLREGTDYNFDNVQIFVESGTADAAFRMTDIAGAATQFTTSGNGLAIKNNVNAALIWEDTATSDFAATVTPAVQEDADISSGITEYDRSWIPGWTR
jgi:hypothetical protein